MGLRGKVKPGRKREPVSARRAAAAPSATCAYQPVARAMGLGDAGINHGGLTGRADFLSLRRRCAITGC